MPRNARVVAPGLPYHITQRGTNREKVFFSVEDRHLYLRILRDNLGAADARVLAYCLMIRHRDIGHDWNLTEAQLKLLDRYLAANRLLDMMNEARNLTQATREKIENEMLLPAASPQALSQSEPQR